MKLGDYLRQHRLSQGEFAETIGTSDMAVSRYCRGRVPAADVMARILAATGGQVTPNDFYDLPKAAAEGGVAAGALG